VQKDTDDLTVIFALLRSAHVKAVLKMLVKLTPEDVDGLVVQLLRGSDVADVGKDEERPKGTSREGRVPGVER